jgi:hypothetical protein
MRGFSTALILPHIKPALISHWFLVVTVVDVALIAHTTRLPGSAARDCLSAYDRHVFILKPVLSGEVLKAWRQIQMDTVPYSKEPVDPYHVSCNVGPLKYPAPLRRNHSRAAATEL